VAVAEHLDFDVARFEHVLFDEDAVVAEGVAGFVDAGGEAFVRFGVVVGNAQTFTTAAGGGLDHHRITDLPGDFDSGIGAIDGIVVARNGVDLGFDGQLLGLDLVAHLGDRVVLRTDELDPFRFQSARELGVLGQEAVTRMDRFSTSLLAGSDDLVGDQVGLFRRGRADADSFVCHVDEQCVLVGFGIDGNGRDAHLAGSLDHAAGNFAAVGNEDFLEHVGSSFFRIEDQGARADSKPRLTRS